VFDGNRSRPYTPADEASPLSAYGRSKLGGEIAALAHARNLVIRTSWVYGNHGQNFVKTMLRLLSQKNELGVVSDQIGTPTHADSLARAIWVLSRKQAKGLLHFTDAGVASWYDFAVAVQEEGLKLGLLRREIPILPIGTADYPTPAKRPRYSVLDKTQCWEVLDGRSRHWRVELRSMLAAEKELHG
jgi:dTDP-4-dehydrorhamnose reductase